jgi:hypothetical protein
MPRTETIACGIRGPMPPDGTFCISSRRVWRPGSYDSQATARRAQKLTDGSSAIANCRERTGCWHRHHYGRGYSHGQ